MGILTKKGNKLFKDNKEHQVFSGAMHYFRTMPDDWYDRLLKLRECGLNTVETYVPWNLHEPREGEFCFEGICDIEKFLDTAKELSLDVILRPGPYICAEWEFGGFPWWLLKYKELELRCCNEIYMEKVKNFFDVLLPKIKPYLSTNGGNIIACAVENEYGSYGTDKQYLQFVKNLLTESGVNVLLFNADGTTPSQMSGGSLKDVMPTANFGSAPRENFEMFRKFHGETPNFCMEYWDGWFEHWGYEHIERSPIEVEDDIRAMKENGDSFNLYMFHGGTNFGFMNGANLVDGQGYRPTVTSYDYDALLTEDGVPTEKYFRVQSVLNPHGQKDFSKVYADVKEIKLTKKADFFSNINKISDCKKSPMPHSFEELQLGYGFVLYRTNLVPPIEKMHLHLTGLHDRAQIFVNGEEKAVYYRGNSENKLLELEINDNTMLDILVENTGRVNYGPHLHDEKGIKRVFFGDGYGFTQMGFENYAVNFEALNTLDFEKSDTPSKCPAFLKGEFEIGEIGDFFIKTDGFTKGVIFINGFNIGRYWNIGPQNKLYVPHSILKEGKNEIIVFELHGYETNKLYTDFKRL